MLEIRVKVSNADNSTVTNSKFLEYATDIHLSTDDPRLVAMRDKALKAFGDQPDEVVMFIKMVW
jgi:hypothetical protein